MHNTRLKVNVYSTDFLFAKEGHDEYISSSFAISWPPYLSLHSLRGHCLIGIGVIGPSYDYNGDSYTHMAAFLLTEDKLHSMH